MTIDGASPLKSATAPMSAIGKSKARAAYRSDSNLPASKELAETFCDNSSVNVEAERSLTTALWPNRIMISGTNSW